METLFIRICQLLRARAVKVRSESVRLPAQESASSGCVNAEAELHIEHLTRVEHVIRIEGLFDQAHVFDFLRVSGVVQIRLL